MSQSKDSDQVQTLSSALQNDVMSSMDPTVILDTVGQMGQLRPISTLWARKAARMSLACFDFQSIINMLALLLPTTRSLRLFRCSTVMARASCICLRRAAIRSADVRLAVA